MQTAVLFYIIPPWVHHSVIMKSSQAEWIPGALAFCNMMTRGSPAFSMEPSTMLGIVPSAPALKRLLAILNSVTFVLSTRGIKAEP